MSSFSMAEKLGDMNDQLAHESEVITRSPSLTDEPGSPDEKLALAGEFAHDDDATMTSPGSESSKRSRTSLVFWILVNVASTVSIVSRHADSGLVSFLRLTKFQTFVNKALFSDPVFRKCQFILAAYHLALTWATLQIGSSCAVFTRRTDVRLRTLLPLAMSMALSVVFTNSSLAHCSIPFFQTIRVLLTPCVACLNLLLYGTKIPLLACFTLVPVCIGAATMAVYDVKQSGNPQVHAQTSTFGASLALTSLLTSAIYTVWVSYYHTKLEIQSQQLLHRQSPISALLLAVAVPFFDTLPSSLHSISAVQWYLIIISGLCACLINLSQFYILGGAGPTTGTVVGHAKTVIIVLLGWLYQGFSTVSVQSLAGCLLAILGIALYSLVTIYHKTFSNT